MRLTAFDVETAGVDRKFALQPFRATLAQYIQHGRKQAWLTSYATAERGQDGELVLDGDLYPTHAMLKSLLETWATTGTYVVGWNMAFDVAWLIALGLRDEVFACKWLDAMLLYKHLTSSPRYLPDGSTVAPKSYGLKPAVKEFFPEAAGYGDNIEFEIDMASNPQGGEDLLHYNKLDSGYTLQLCERFLLEMTPEQLRCALIEAQCIPLVADTTVRGITTDTAAAQALSDKLSDDAKLAFVTLKMSAGQDVSEAVLASPKQLAELLYDKWGLPVQKVTNGGAGGAHKPSTDKEALGDLADIDPRAKLVRDYREARNNRTKFAEAIIESAAYNGDGCTRPAPRVFGTYTGRMTYSSKQGKGKEEVPVGVALHQWKNGAEFRAQLVAPEGFTLLEHDFAGQEFKWMAVESGDQAMLRLCQPGEDPHSFMGSRIDRSDYRQLMRDVADKKPGASAIRKLGKVGNLSCQYRTGPSRLQTVAKTQYDVRLSTVQAKAIHGTYQTSYPGVPRYWNRQIALAKQLGYVETLGGRRVQLGKAATWDMENKWSYESTALNFPIQGVGADQKYLALAVLRDYLPSVDGYLYYELHDGIFTIVPDRYAEQAADEIRCLLSNLPYKQAWGRTFPIQFPVDAKLGKSWGTLKEFH